MIIVTAGMLKSFSECPQKYNLIYNEQLEIPSNAEFTDIGKDIHALINYKFKGFDIKKLLQSLNTAQNKSFYGLWQNFLSFKIETVLKSEFTFTVPLSDKVKLTGRVDAIRKCGDNYEILDWKTGNSKNIDPENDMQTIIYLYSVCKLLNCQGLVVDCVNLSLTYFFLKEKKSVTVPFSLDKYKKYEKLLFDETDKILKSDLKRSKTSSCEKCSFKIVCKQAYKPN